MKKLPMARCLVLAAALVGPVSLPVAALVGPASLPGVASLVGPASLPGAQVPFEQVVANLQAPKPNDRMTALRMLRDAGFAEAIVPAAALLTDPDNRVQHAALETEVSFFLARRLETRRRIALVVEVRGPSAAEAAFDAEPGAVLRRPVPAVLMRALSGAMRDETPAVQAQAMYVLGAIGRPPVDAAIEAQLTALIAHPDVSVSIAAMRAAGRLQVKSAGESLIIKLNERQAPPRFAALDALGQLREDRAVEAVANLVKFHGNDLEGRAAFEALARIGHPASTSLFTPRLADRDDRVRQRAAEGLGLAGDRQLVSLLESGLSVDRSETVRLAMVYALHRLGRPSIDLLVQGLLSPKTVVQAREYFLALSPGVNANLQDYLRSASAPTRAAAAEMLGIIADGSSLLVLQPLASSEPDPDARAAIVAAIERIRIAYP